MNLPNRITLFRITLIPIIVLLTFIPELSQKVFFDNITLLNIIILIIFLVGVFSDFLDGYLARKYDLITNFGKFADPLADKILVLTVMVILVEQQSLLGSWAVILILARELAVTGFRVIAAGEQIVIAAGKMGKIKTNFQFIMTALLLVFGQTTIQWLKISLYGLIIITVVLTIISGLEYILKNKQVLYNK